MQEQRNLNHQLSLRLATVIVALFSCTVKRAKTSPYSALNEAIQNAKQVSLQCNLILMSHPRMHLKKNNEKGQILNLSTDTANKWLNKGVGGSHLEQAVVTYAPIYVLPTELLLSYCTAYNKVQHPGLNGKASAQVPTASPLKVQLKK